MRVAVVLPERSPETGGGFTLQETLRQALSEAAQGARHEFVYFQSASRDSAVRLRTGAASKAARRTVRAIRDFQDRVLGLRLISMSTTFERSLRQHSIDLVWFTTQYAEDCGLPYIATVFDLEYLDQPWFPEVSANGEWDIRHAHYRRYLPKATRVVVPNESGREQVMRHFGLRASQILTLPHPTPQLPAPLDIGELLARHSIEPPFLLYPAQYWAHKNHATLLEALKLLNADGGRRYRLVCVGSDKGQRRHVQSLVARLGVEEDVRLLGFVPAEELASFYRGAHALVYLSYFGPENLPPLEAFALGCPVVNADIPGAREQLGEAALLVPPADAEACATAVRRLEDAGQRQQLVDRGAQVARERSAAAFVRSVIDFLDEFEAVRRCWT
jgi:glycosyltransferase involved in cell wall biosynthesis